MKTTITAFFLVVLTLITPLSLAAETPAAKPMAGKPMNMMDDKQMAQMQDNMKRMQQQMEQAVGEFGHHGTGHLSAELAGRVPVLADVVRGHALNHSRPVIRHAKLAQVFDQRRLRAAPHSRAAPRAARARAPHPPRTP